MLSDDLVAIEQASMDMINKATPLPDSAASDMGVQSGTDIFKALHNRPAHIQTSECEKLGLGTAKYELIELSS
jgi:uncharacterized Fe-S center protein